MRRALVSVTDKIGVVEFCKGLIECGFEIISTGGTKKVLDDNGVTYQMAEMARVDVGGGGTIAKFAAYYGMEVIDCGVAVLSMHAPWEITSVFDVESAYNCYKAFLTL